MALNPTDQFLMRQMRKDPEEKRCEHRQRWREGPPAHGPLGPLRLEKAGRGLQRQRSWQEGLLDTTTAGPQLTAQDP